MSKDRSPTIEVRQDYQGACFLIAPAGNSLHSEKFIWGMLINAKWDEKSLNFYVFSRTLNEDRTLTTEWSCALMQAAVKRLTNGKLTAFDRNDLTNSVEDENEDATSITLTLSQTAFEKLEREQEYSDRAERSFSYAVERLSNFAYGPSERNYSEIASMLFFLERSLACAYLGSMHSWYYEKLNMIRRYLPSLAKRKQRSHPNFRHEQDYVTSNLSSFTAPKAWVDRPNSFDDRILREGMPR